MKKFVFIASLAISMVISAAAQPYQKTELGIKTVINSVGIEIQFYNPSMVRVLNGPKVKPLKRKLSVIKTPKKRLSELSNPVTSFR